MTSIYDRFLQTAQKYPDNVFLIEVTKGGLKESSYSKILDRVNALAQRLLDLPVESGSRIMLISESCTDWVIAFLAANRVGCIVVPLDPDRLVEEWIDSIAHAEPSVLIVSSRFDSSFEALEKASPAFQRGLYFGSAGKDRPGWESFDEWTRPLSSRPVSELKERRFPEVAMIFYTSGTLGHSKAVQLTNQSLLSNSGYMYRFSEAEPDAGGRVLSIAPLHHVLGMNALLSVFYSASGMTLFPTIDRELILKAFSEVRPHYVIAVPSFYQKLAANIEERFRQEAPKLLQKRLDHYIQSTRTRAPRFMWLHKLLFRKVRRHLGGRIKDMASGGAALDSSIIKLFYFLGLPLYEGYGLTESTGAFSFNRPGHYKIGSVGKPFAKGTEARIDSPNGEGIGELCLRGPLVMRGYYRDDEANQKAFDADAWFHTGDLARMDSDGFLYFVGRVKDVIISANGQNVYPEELERRFNALPMVQELCVFGIPSAPGSVNEQVHLHIVPDAESVTQKGLETVKEQIQQKVAELVEDLAPYRRPASLTFSRTPLPRTSSLKVKKNVLRQAMLKESAFRPSSSD